MSVWEKVGNIEGPPGDDSTVPGPPGPSAVSADPGNTSVIGTDSFIHTPHDSTKESTGVAASLVTAHEAAPDPHPQYLTPAEGDGRYTQGGLTPATGDARYLQLTGGVLSGPLAITSESSGVTATLDSAVSQQSSIELRSGGLLRWLVAKSAAPEDGGNAGANFEMHRYSDSESWLGIALSVNRATGLITVAADPAAPLGVATKQYVDGKAPTLPPETDGASNTSYGVNALPIPGTAFESTAVGYGALMNATAGQGTAIGYLALGAVPSAYESTAIGNAAARTATGTSLTVVGHGAGYYPVSLGAASGATLMGAFSVPYAQGSGVNSVAVGKNTRVANDGVALGAYAEARGTGSIAIGRSVIATADNEAVIGTAATAVKVPGTLTVAGKAVLLGPESEANGNTGYGVASQPSPVGGNNTVFGYSSQARAGSTGTFNVAVGAFAQPVSSGQRNMAMGYYAQGALTTGSRNIGIGHNAQLNLLDGTDNVAVGDSALKAVTTGNTNVAVGSNTLTVLTTGISNMAVGHSALQNVTTGGSNVGIGNTALFGVTTGAQNVGIGHAAGHSTIATTTQNFQTFIGSGAEQYVTGTGDRATAIGYGAKAHTGAVAIGAQAEARGIDSVALGKGAIANSDNQIVLGTPTHNVLVSGWLDGLTGAWFGGQVLIPTTPTTPESAASKAYVDSRPSSGMDQATADARYLQLTGGTLTGDISTGHNIRFPTADTAIAQTVDGIHVANMALNAYRPISVADPTHPIHAATKQYVDVAVALLTARLAAIGA